MRGDRSWSGSYVIALAIVAYFVVATVWLPSWVLGLSLLADAPNMVRDLIGSGVWALFVAAGVFGLRLGQRSGLI
jgi:Co/Zn/Cd efflux system component